MSHGVKRQRESVEKEAARREKEKSQINEYRSLTNDVMRRVTRSIFRQLIVFSEVRMTCRKLRSTWPLSCSKRILNSILYGTIVAVFYLTASLRSLSISIKLFNSLEIRNRLVRYCFRNYSFSSFDSVSIQNAIGYGSIVNGVLKSVLTLTGTRNWNSSQKCSKQIRETVLFPW